MADEVTLVNPDKNPSKVTTSDPTHITQLKSEGYQVKEAPKKSAAKKTTSSGGRGGSAKKTTAGDPKAVEAGESGGNAQ